MTPLGGEWRFASAVANRLQQLGAITQGDRRATAGSGIQGFAIDKKYGRLALKSMYEAICSKLPTEQVPDFLQHYNADPPTAFGKFAKRVEEAMHRSGLMDDDKGAWYVPKKVFHCLVWFGCLGRNFPCHR